MFECTNQSFSGGCASATKLYDSGFVALLLKVG